MPTEPDSPSQPVPRPPLPWVARWLMLAFSVLCLVLGLIGAVVPGMPTTVFILLSAWAAARSSPRLHAWLRRNRVFGPMLVNWQRGGFVSRRAKWSATATMSVCAAVILLTAHRRWGACIAIGSMAIVLVWLWRRPEPA
ncbi:DUF454 family protein [Xylophilus rhododendri]|uniref:DUF454 family protein n=1 Tax=Xylophilus rhododendri TaxID=2697032 RepID=A0A857J3G5_9BURK|nr:YbaN family protein [Xylophilus rhododendri]QHI97679.1 DUF454 family protein [Xylophilus rhododendri]